MDQEQIVIDQEIPCIDPTDKIPDELKEGLAAAVTVYVNVFSQPPFSESWVIEKSNNPELTIGDDISKNPNRIFALMKLVLNTDYVHYFGKDETGSYFDIGNNPEDLTRIRTDYPLKDILNAYTRDILNQKSVVYLRYLNNKGKKVNKELKVGEPITDIEDPISIARIRFIEEGVNEKILEEVGSYIKNPEDEQKVLESVNPNQKTVYLAEIASIKKGEGFLKKTLFYCLGRFKPLPQQIVFLTRVGTSILPEEESNGGTDRLFSIISSLAYRGKPLRSTTIKSESHQGSVIIKIYNTQS